jgi:menaquinone-dependent protoporphyrinogen oxidase
MKLLIVYGTTEGHTGTVARHMAEVARSESATVDVFDSAELLEPIKQWPWHAALLGGSVHQGHHQMSLRAFVLANLTRLNQRPSAFFSLSLSAAVKDQNHQDDARSYATTFLHEVSWQPLLTACFAGAIKHSEYDYFRRMVLKLLASQLEPGIITTNDVVYTDWALVETFTKNFLERSKQLSATHSL